MVNFYIGIDFGTSGARSITINSQGTVVAQTQFPFPPPFTDTSEWVSIWKTALFDVIQQIPLHFRRQIDAIAINGTSATVLLCDTNGIPLQSPILYNDSRAITILEQLKKIAPADHIVNSATSSLAKLIWWLTVETANTKPQKSAPHYFLHQADWLGFLLHGKLGISDYHNSLKLGYDVKNLTYPNWLINGLQSLTNLELLKLPDIVAPGTPITTITPEIAEQLKLPKTCVICAGTTDSIAAFLASGAKIPGEAVTSLGSTLVLKLLSNSPVNHAKYGIYSHRLGDLWLTGGASNTGGAVLRQFFSDRSLENFSRQINPNSNSNLNYYPLIKKGDRFPINDPELLPRLQPRPENPVEFLQGLLEGIAKIEAQGYQLLQQLGATPLTQVYTAGGGAKNPIWTAIRQRYLNVNMVNSIHTEAAYGSALLALGKLTGLTHH
ncbi:MAG TPA: FGGY-family carbohydrate kinase [Candidatus Obscuribacterales bacterium]